MNIDIETIIREEVRNLIREHINISDETVEVTVNSKRKPGSGNASKWEYGPIPGKRRNAEEIALHELELQKGRKLTPEEKGEAKALIEMDETTENQAKEAAIKKVRIEKIAAEGMAAAAKELEKEAGTPTPQKSSPHKLDDPPATIPQTENLNSLNSLFGE